MPSSSQSARRWLRRTCVAVLVTAASTGAVLKPVAAMTSPEQLVPSQELAAVGIAMDVALQAPIDQAELTAGHKAIGDDSATDAHVVTYLRQAKASAVLAQQAEELVGAERYAGISLDVAGEKIRLFLAGPDFEAVKAALAGSLPSAVTILKVDMSLAQLRDFHSRIVGSIEQLEHLGVHVVAVGEYVATNKVGVGVTSEITAAQAALDALIPDAAGHVVAEAGPTLTTAVCQSRTSCPAHVTTPVTIGLTGPVDEKLRAGIRIEGGGHRCTSAFAARRTSDNAVMVLTAGHCFTAGTEINHGPVGKIGKVSDSHFDPSWRHDGAAIKVQDTSVYRWVPNNWVYTPSNMEQQILQAYNRSGGLETSNAPLTKQGDTTNETFGQVSRTGVTVVCNTTCNNGGPAVTLDNMTEARMCAEQGDSGGPVHWGFVAHGIISLAANLDSNGKCPSNPLTYFNIISDLEADLGVRIYESS